MLQKAEILAEHHILVISLVNMTEVTHRSVVSQLFSALAFLRWFSGSKSAECASRSAPIICVLTARPPFNVLEDIP